MVEDKLDILRTLAVFGSGLLAGFINTVAGGGSLLTLPALIFLGLPPAAANATNRVGIVLQNVVASTTFHREQLLPWSLGLKLLLVGIPGAVIGALLAMKMDETTFRRVLALVMLLVLVSVIRRKPARRPDQIPAIIRPALLHASYFLVGIYAGFIQAGVGFLIIAVLTSFGGLGLVRTNAVKVFTLLVIQATALLVFAEAELVRWGWGLVLAAGTMIGGWAGVRWQVESGEVWVRRILIAAVLVFAVKLMI